MYNLYAGPLSKLPSLLARLPDLERGVTRLLHRTAGPSELVSTVQALTRVRDKLGAVAAEAAAAGQDGERLISQPPLRFCP